MHKRRFYLPSESIYKNKHSDIIGPDALQIARVLRMTVGECIEIFDGTGTQYIAKIIYISNELVKVTIIGTSNNDRESSAMITMAQAILKDKKMDILIRQLTELGINSWVPFNASRSVPILNPDRMVARIKRWRRISIEAVKQSDRGILPQIYFPKKFGDILALSKAYDISIIFWEGKSSGSELLQKISFNVENILIVIGPEGGFERSEIEDAKSSGFIVANLGPRILRAETASIAACSIVQYLFGDMGKKTLTI